MRNLLVAALLLLLYSCDTRTAAEKQRDIEKYNETIRTQVVDSINNANAQKAILDENKRLKEQLAADSVAHIEKANEAKQAQLRQAEKDGKAIRDNDKKIIIAMAYKLQAQLQGEQARMESIKSFQLTRTSSEKIAQIQNQAQVINGIKYKLGLLKDQADKLKAGEPYYIPNF